MKYFILAIILCGIPAQAASILSASNLAQKKIALVLSTGEEKKPRELMLFRLEDHLSQKISWPEKVGQEEVLGLIQSEKSLLLISQWTSGGGKFPHLHHYSFSSGKWIELGEIKCRSFDQVKIEKKSLSVECEEDPLSDQKAQSVSFLLPENFDSVSLTFPLAKGSTAKISYELKGTMFSWEKLEVSQGKSKKLFTANDLLKLR